MRFSSVRGRLTFRGSRSRAAARWLPLCAAVLWFATNAGEARALPACTGGPAAAVALSLSPSSIPADGQSVSTAIATVTDAGNNPVCGDTVQLSSPDSGQQLGALTDNGNGEYIGTIRSSMTPDQVAITATDVSVSPHVSGQATLTQTNVPTTTYLSAPESTTTDQPVTLTAAVSAGAGGPAGAIVFKANGAPISGCSTLIAPASPIARCEASFAGAESTESLTATFTPYSSSEMSSTSASVTLAVGRGTPTISVSASRAIVPIGGRVVYAATVKPPATGPANPGGRVAFYDHGSPIASCGVQELSTGGTASCTVSYAKAGSHTITAQYGGDSNFVGIASSPGLPISVGTFSVAPARAVTAVMQWTFSYTGKYTKVRALSVSGVGTSSSVLVRCSGRGCPFGTMSRAIRASTQKASSLNLTSRVRRYALPVGSKLSIAIVHTGWVGKYYLFTIRASRPPSVAIKCLPPGRTRPGGAC